MSTIHEQIKRGMALAFFASAYADQADECGQSLRGEIMAQLPTDIDPAALHAADILAADLLDANREHNRCRDNGAATLPAVYAFAQYLQGDRSVGYCGDRELSPELFGHYCAMQAMGHGVGLDSFGSAVADNIRVPYVEFGSYSLGKDYFEPVGGDV